VDDFIPPLPGLTDHQRERLTEFVRHGQMLAPESLLLAANAHLDDLQMVHGDRSPDDAHLAGAIYQVLGRVVSEWDRFSPSEQSWLRGVMQYFSRSDDAVPDDQPGGLDDDVMVLNACLRFVGRAAWQLDDDHPDSYRS